ncbi:MAG: hypothetical protein P1Q69_20460, partial [Candidatus Thorarchaeota archaeon]|nr:hypothetical protein [Candidatus Thorarchaeota archaeon]
MKVYRKTWISLVAILVTAIFMGQLLAGVGFTADMANSGPKIAIVKMTNDENVEWAEDDIIDRLEPLIVDDPFIKNRITLYDIDDVEELSVIDGDIIIYLSHGGTKGLMIGENLLTWAEMAEFVMKSDASLHLFAACKSKEIIKYGDDDSEKHL